MSTANAQKTPLGLSLNRHARAKALDQIWKRGLSLPCQVVNVQGSIVQVSFQIQQNTGTETATLQNVTIPVAISEYTRLPIQAGCKGVAMSADAYLGGMSGIGGGVASLTQQGNLTALVFQPISNNGWFAVNGQILTMYGPGGVTLMDQAKTTFINLIPGQIQLIASGHTLTVGAAGISMDGIVFATHVHGGVAHGGANTDPPV
jgi:GpV Apex motif